MEKILETNTRVNEPDNFEMPEKLGMPFSYVELIEQDGELIQYMDGVDIVSEVKYRSSSIISFILVENRSFCVVEGLAKRL